MSTRPTSFATDPLLFGRRMPVAPVSPEAKPESISEDLRTFAMTFAAGFLFMSVFLA